MIVVPYSEEQATRSRIVELPFSGESSIYDSSRARFDEGAVTLPEPRPREGCLRS